MTTTEFSLGLNTETRPSSRVLKPPGGGHTSLFGEPDVKPNPPRPSYNQQNSSNLSTVMNTTDANVCVQQLREQAETKPDAAKPAGTNEKASPPGGNAPSNNAPGGRGRVPPGGFSAGGFW